MIRAISYVSDLCIQIYTHSFVLLRDWVLIYFKFKIIYHKTIINIYIYAYKMMSIYSFIIKIYYTIENVIMYSESSFKYI